MSSMPILLLLVSSALPAVDNDLVTVGEKIQQPAREYTSGPLWVWNDLLTPEALEHSLDALAEAHIRQVWVHPRPGLMTPYLSEDWFALWASTLEAARKRDMLVWIYDENSYPSGFAGGLVPEAMPESRALGLKFTTRERMVPSLPNVFAVYRTRGTAFENVTEAHKNQTLPADGPFVVVQLEEAKNSPWYAGRFHVDLLRPGVTEKFLEVTMEPYRKHFGAEFGKRIPGVFTDEPHLKGAGEVHWTPDLPEQFQQRWGYTLMDALPAMKDDSAQGRRLRHNYFQLLHELFVERWAKPYYDYCTEHGLEFTGHYWEHDWPKSASVPDNMGMSAWQHRPGIDILFNQYDEGPHAQFGNVRAVLELASVANQTGRARTLCETYGGSGAEMRFQDYKRIGDWVAVLGVNTINEHLSDVTIRGARKRDYPPTFSYHSPWMDSYKVLVDYFARVSYALSQGQQINPCIVLEPTTTAWMHHFDGTPVLEELGDSFQAMVVALAKEQLEFDLGSEQILRERGAVVQNTQGNPALEVGERRYSAVIIPAGMANLNAKTFALLESYVAQGGVVFSCAGPDLPSHIDAQPDARCDALRQAGTWRHVALEALTAAVQEYCKPTLRVVLDNPTAGIVYHHRRQLADGDIVFLTNTSEADTATGSILTNAGGVREVVLNTGAIRAYPFAPAKQGQIMAQFTLPPCGSLMLFLDKQAVPSAPAAPIAGARTKLALGPISVQRVDDNNLLLDYVDVAAGGEALTGVFWRKAAELTFKNNGLPGNLWDHAVQFGDELLRTPFPEGSGFEATYTFEIEGGTPTRLFAVIERADLYTVTCNDVPVSAAPGAWWLDRAFGKLDIAHAVHTGRNTLHLKAAPMTVFHELEAAHLVGDFGLKPAERGFVLVPAAPLVLGAWNQQGLPFFGHRVAYRATVTAKVDGARFVVALPAWNGVVARVRVNGEEAGHIYHAPMECDITAHLVTGQNQIEVEVCGSLRNTLGPNLGDPGTGITHPGSWNKAPETPQPPGADYFSIGYGLIEAFEVHRIALD
jgi:hypothetical protein